jgi:hypothetical protein
LSISFSFGTHTFCHASILTDLMEEEPTAHGPAPTSNFNTLVISEEHRTAAETSPPPQHNPGEPTPVPSP